MSKIVDLSLLRQVTTDAMRVYEAVDQGQVLTNEIRIVFENAQELLQWVTFAFLPEEIEIVDTEQSPSQYAREALITEYIDIQKAYASLKDSLYQLMQVYISANKWIKAEQVRHSLEKIEPGYRDITSLETVVNKLKLAEIKFSKNQLSDTITYIRAGLGIRDGTIHSLLEGKPDEAPFLLDYLEEVTKKAIYITVEEKNWAECCNILIARSTLGNKGQIINWSNWFNKHSIPYLMIYNKDIKDSNGKNIPDIQSLVNVWNTYQFNIIEVLGQKRNNLPTKSLILIPPKDGVFIPLPNVEYDPEIKKGTIVGLLLYNPN